MPSIQRLCSVDNCNKKLFATGLCHGHWMIKDSANPTRLLRPWKPLNGLSYTSEYSIWASMIDRCKPEKSSKEYAVRYAGRGISVDQRWADPLDGFENFILDMDWSPREDLTLDRIDGNGNYKPGNCRWATWTQQHANRQRSRVNTSGYIGVSPAGQKKPRWRASIGYEGVNYKLGNFEDPERAALEYDKACIFFKGTDGVTNIL